MIRRKRISWLMPVLIGVILVLLPLLAYFQYQWLGKVSEGERRQRQEDMSRNATEFRDDFEAEIGRIRDSFQIRSGSDAAKLAAETSFALSRWKKTAPHPELVRDVFFIALADPSRIQQFNASRSRYEETEWPSGLEVLHDSLQGKTLQAPLTESGIAAVMVNVLDARKLPTGQVIMKLDLQFIQKTLIPDLAAKHHLSAVRSDYETTIVDPGPPGRVIYSNSGSNVPATTGDVCLPVFVSRASIIYNVVRPVISYGGPIHLSAGPPVSTNKTFAFEPNPDGDTDNAAADADRRKFKELRARIGQVTTIKGNVVPQPVPPIGPAAVSARTVSTVTTAAMSADSGAWQLFVTLPRGQLDAAVAQARMRNFGISFGVLILLATTIGLILLSVRRERLLAMQQMEFVSAVSHELRTPLAVICSAGENLADGVVRSADQARQYGTVVRDEGRRLTGMVEHILEFGGIHSGRRSYQMQPTDVQSVIDRAIGMFESHIRDAGVTVDRNIAADIPKIMADPAAMVCAVQNLIGNALKYGDAGKWIGLNASGMSGAVTIVVEDHGAGILPVDLPHIFEPFYRSRTVIDAQMKGSGIGLSLVKRIVDAHDARIGVESVRGRGSKFTLVFPAGRASG